MSEKSSPIIDNEPKNKLGDSLVNIGKKIKEFSDQEVSNKQVIAGLAVLGVAQVCLVAGASFQGSQLSSLADKFTELGQMKSNSGMHQLSADYYGLAASLHGKSADAHIVSAVQSLVLAGEVAVLGGIEIPRYANFKQTLIDMGGKTKVSTHVGPILAEVFLNVGNHFNKNS